MRRNFITLFLSAALSPLLAQLNGTVTVNSASVTAANNYQSFSDLALALDTNGINGPLTIDVIPNSGPYIEQVEFTAIIGASALNRIYVNGNNNVLTFNGSSASTPWILGLNGSDYFSFNNLNIVGTGAYAYCAMLGNGADFNIFTACTFSAPFNSFSPDQIPVMFSSASTSSTGYNAKFNLFRDCEMYNGYAGISSGGGTGNTFEGCLISDFYIFGITSSGSRDLTFKNNILERPNRTFFFNTAAFASHFLSNSGLKCEGNHYRRMFESNLSSVNPLFAIWTSGGQSGNSPEVNVIQNNLIYNIRHNGGIEGIRTENGNAWIYHNTISLDYVGATSGFTRGMRVSASAGFPVQIRNNIISITRGGSGNKIGLDLPIVGNITSDRNVIYVASAAGATSTAFYNNQNWPSLSSFQSTGLDLTSYSVNPLFSNLINSLYPTNAAINNQGLALGIMYDAALNIRNQVNPDIGALEFMTPNCSGTPSQIAVFQPSYAICSGEDAVLGIALLNSNTGLAYSWSVSTSSSTGPWTAVPNVSTPFYNAKSVTANSFYKVAQTCTLPGGGSVSAVGSLSLAGLTNSTVPYFEGFESIGRAGRLPNCSWLATAPKTYTSNMPGGLSAYSGNAYAAFIASNGNSAYVTNGIYLNSGLTYSASCRYRLDTTSLPNKGWNYLALQISNSQSSTSITNSIAVNYSLSAGAYSILGSAFSVATSGFYFLQINASPTVYNAPFLAIDDISITSPCDLGNNTPTLSFSSAVSQTICSGEAASFSVTGAVSYSWLPGSASGSIVSLSPLSPSIYTVTGTNGNLCSNSGTVSVDVSVCSKINELSNKIVKPFIFPSSSTGLYTAMFPYEGEKGIQVYNTIGGLILELTTHKSSEVFDLSGYVKGLYYVSIKDNQGYSTHRVLLE